ncbi:uncharacterized protein LOC62_03G004902 [Vanrija pseudolonga]|uniref:Zn(2)-C6 fungal-type domain-containing protein n=1 Tax=Vanrija pseudolonga TaxID=143232 RepID=A0AAF1BQU5_9TREE|nr:hypothetical protein LOC62_03G004902 [Vanrija pseudolonga]
MDPPPATMPPFNGPTRKQNVACDACRAKKVRCLRANTTERCEQCVAKELECTSNYIEQLQNKPRRPRRFKSGDDFRTRSAAGEKRSAPDDDNSQGSQRASPVLQSRRTSGPPAESETNTTSSTRNTRDMLGVDDAMAMLAWMNPSAPSVYSRSPIKDAGGAQADLMRYLFSPTAALHHEWRYSDLSSLEMVRGGNCDMWEEQNGVVWDEAPTAAHLGLWAAGEAEMESLAIELIDSFFAIINSRLPLLDPQSFMSRFTSPMTDPGGPLPHPLLAVVLAFGAKFAENAHITSDRDETSARDPEGVTGRTRSRMVQLLAIRAREVAEVGKVWRVPTVANTQTLILMESLMCQAPLLKRKYQACHLAAASRHLSQVMDSPLDHTFNYAYKDERMRVQLALFIITGFESVFHRLRSEVFDYIVDLTPLIMSGEGAAGGSSYTASDDDAWLTAARAGAVVCRKLSADLWHPRISANGIPLSVLRDFVHEHSSWRDAYLARLGVPLQWPDSWDFVAAIKACSTDIFYHELWLVAERAVRDFGIQGGSDESSHGMMNLEVSQMRERLKHEALHSAMRIAALSAVLLEHGYLRLDPLVLYRPMYDAGMFLARQGREESRALVAGLRQYAGPYPQMWDLALEIEAVLLESAGGAGSAFPLQAASAQEVTNVLNGHQPSVLV